MISRKSQELIEQLLKHLVYVRSDQDITVPIEAANNFITVKKWNEYCTFQSQYKDRVNTLRIEKREVPKNEGDDKNMPNILQCWEGNFKAAQPSRNYKKDYSCAFTETRINQYEALNKSFATCIKQAAPAAAAKIIPLLIMDIAYLKSFDVEWESNPAALGCQGQETDDDEEEIDTQHGMCLIRTLCRLQN